MSTKYAKKIIIICLLVFRNINDVEILLQILIKYEGKGGKGIIFEFVSVFDFDRRFQHKNLV